ncbi:kinase-like domain-containing protein [Cyathus striatus]|nr:kinase-like domain-containing protein [Cyathus striatus]
MSNFLDQQYEPLEIVGRGSFGIVRKVRRMSDGKILARKEVNFHRMNEREGMLITTELNILKHLKHKHIVRFHNMHIDHKAGIIYIFMEYCGGGDLLTFIKKLRKIILLALEYCHHPGHGTVTGSGGEGRNGPPILHRDLKPANVLLDESGSVKLCDFGLSKALEESNLTKTHVGTPYYMSPEIIQGKAYGLKSDIWALGCMIYELCAHKPPFHEAKMRSELCELIQNGRIQPLPKGYSQDLLDVIKSMLRLNVCFTLFIPRVCWMCAD